MLLLHPKFPIQTGSDEARITPAKKMTLGNSQCLLKVHPGYRFKFLSPLIVGVIPQYPLLSGTRHSGSQRQLNSQFFARGCKIYSVQFAFRQRDIR